MDNTPNKTLITLAILGIVLSLVTLARSAEPVESAIKLPADISKGVDDRTVIRVDRGIRYLLRKSPCWGIAADSEARREMARMIAIAARDRGVPPLLLTVIIKRESSFQSHVIGASNGEIGLGQQHGLAAKGCDLSTPQGQLDCSARWLARSYELCGNWRGAVTAYMSGRCQASKRGKLGKAAESRLKQWERAITANDLCEPGSQSENGANLTQWLCEPPEDRCVARIRTINRG